MDNTKNHVVMILVDGMRPDGLLQCGHPFVQTMLKTFTYTLKARTVLPSVTLPCHMSLFHSVDPERHGILTNTYVPQVRPVKGLVEALDEQGHSCAFFYTWEELRDLTRPDHLKYARMINQHKEKDTDTLITDAALAYIPREQPEFSFLYLGETDEVGGHDKGWMSETYEGCIHKAVGCIQRVYEALPPDFTMIVLADHGGHGRCHGTDLPEDMTIPVFFHGPSFPEGRELDVPVSIKDVAPTIAALLGAVPPREWEGTVVVR